MASMVVAGALLAILSGVMNGFFTLPMRFLGRWQWENVWSLFIVFACLLLPAVLISLTAPDSWGVLAGSPSHAVWVAIATGFAWGFGSIMFGQSVSAIGISLANTFVLAISSILGSLLPLLIPSATRLLQPTGRRIVIGVLIEIMGIVLCGRAGSLREKAVGIGPKAGRGDLVGKARPLGVALLLVTGSGVLSAVFNVGFTLAQPIADHGRSAGLSQFASINLIWFIILAAGSIANLGFCFYLFARNGSLLKFRQHGSGRLYSLTLVMGLLWGGSIFVYGAAAPRLGSLGTSIGWPLSLAMGLLTANAIGLALGEWKAAPRPARRWMFSGIGILLVAIVVLSLASSPMGETDMTVLDVLRVRADGDASAAVVSLKSGPEQTYHCDVAIIGGGMGGVSAALETAHAGHTVCMTEPTLWIGGQMTSEGVSAMDDNKWIETTGATASYRDLSRRIRQRYAGKEAPTNFNPGNCWVSHLCFEPSAGEDVLRAMIQPLIAGGMIHLWLHTVPVTVFRQGRLIRSVSAYDLGHGQWLRIEANYFVDASELGDVIALSGLPFRLGAEARSDTGERDAPETADPGDIQSITYPFILSRRSPQPSQKPPGYDLLKSKYGLVVDYGHGKFLTYGVFARNPGTPGSFWDYRRLVDASQFRPQEFAGDLSMINWSSNDYCDSRLLSTDPQTQAQALQRAKRLSLGFAWWLQHDAPRDDHAGLGYPELGLQRAAMGSEDALSQQPYIRESRRMLALHTIVEESVAVDFQKGARAAEYPDTVGIGQYSIDIHSCARQDFISATKPYEIPLGALIARDADNLLAASKDIGTTHISNGAYRLHPTEWSIGEAVGAVVAWSLDHQTSPAAVDRSAADLIGLQRRLLQQGHPIFWFDDVGADSPFFKGSQLASARSWIVANSSTLHFDGSTHLSGEAVANALERAGLGSVPALRATGTPTWQDLRRGKLAVPAEDGVISRGDFAVWLLKVTAN